MESFNEFLWQEFLLLLKLRVIIRTTHLESHFLVLFIPLLGLPPVTAVDLMETGRRRRTM